jgi:hypothetical protein
VTRPILYIAVWCACAAALVAAGIHVGREHPGAHKIVVRTDHRSLHELPRWACREIVDLRMQKLQMFHQMVRAYSKPHEAPPELILFKLGDRRQCR